MSTEQEQAATAEPIEAEQVETAQADTGAEPGKEPQATDTQVEKQDEAKPKGGGVQKRISELTQKRREAEARAAEAERRLAEYQASAGKSDDDKAPALEAFDTYDGYVAARARWEARQELRQQQQAQAEGSRKAAQEQRSEVLRQEFADRVTEARARMPDFDAVAFSASVPVTPAMTDAILESDIGADVAYYLGKHPDIAHRLASMSPVSVAREIGRIEQLILSQPVNVPVTKAPEPVKPVGQKAPIARDPDQMTDEEYFAWRKAQKSAR